MYLLQIFEISTCDSKWTVTIPWTIVTCIAYLTCIIYSSNFSLKSCRHNTFGDQCQMCKPGYVGDARRGSKYDCKPGRQTNLSVFLIANNFPINLTKLFDKKKTTNIKMLKFIPNVFSAHLIIMIVIWRKINSQKDLELNNLTSNLTFNISRN